MFSNYLLQHPLIGANGLKAWPHLLPIDNKGYIGPGSPAGGITADHLRPQQPMQLGAGQGYACMPFAPYKGGIGMVPGSGDWQSGPQARINGGNPFAVQQNTGLSSGYSGGRPFAVQQNYGMQRPAQQPMQQRAMVRY